MMGASKVITADLEAGRPVVRDALLRLDGEITAAKTRGARVLRVIHGYGSSGKGGRIRKAARLHLDGQRASGRIRSWLAGENYTDLAVEGQRLLAAAPGLRATLRTDADNPGITIVEL